MTASPIRIANCSGFFGDRPSAAEEMVMGGPIDVLTGDWLAELTMLILSRIRNKNPNGGYARTFVTQMEQVMGSCLDKGVKVVSNAGGLNPRACAEAVNDIAEKLGLNPTIAYVDGDDLMERIHELSSNESLLPFLPDTSLGDLGSYLTANAYLGCWGIVEALNQQADIVITGRVTDAAVVCGPAAWHHGWERNDFDQLAGAVVAGHIIECGAQATGGNYSFFTDIPDRNETGSTARFGFPWADIAYDGSSIIGKHDGTGGLINTETITSQILYEIGGPEYLGPDVTARFDTIEIENISPNRVKVSEVKGQAPPSTLKVAMNELGGYRNSFSVALTGLDIDEKAAFAQAAFWDSCPYEPDDFETISSEVIRTDKQDPDQQEKATAIWKVTVKDKDERKVGRTFTDAMIHTVLAGIPGMYSLGSGPTAASPYGIYRPALVPADLVPQYVHLLGGATSLVESSNPQGKPLDFESEASLSEPVGPSNRVAIGTICGTRSGDKGGDANLGVYARSDQAWAWLDHTLTVDKLKELLPETADLTIERYRYPKIRSLNFLVRGLLQEGVAASTRQDPQAKALGEWLRSRYMDIPVSVLKEAKG
ncbi:MAG: acyclic terpene utilization AtuA family protein [Actinomycetota bacterium]|nr:acyclic terpene utilization AtuA family protein [Actinomycetota bacterium]MEC8974632.1 acyclic terpene utilization AtuA family protein [Actinomycetota bacterium]